MTKAGITVKTTKTGRTRSVPLAPLAIDALKERRQQYVAERLAAGPGYLDEGYSAIRKIRERLKKPLYSAEEYLATLNQQG